MNTIWLLMARYEGLPIVPLKLVVRDYFGHLTEANFLRKVQAGEIDLPVVRIEHSQKSAKGISLMDLANYIDKRIAAARKENAQLFKPSQRYLCSFADRDI